jgi:ABC-type anion transport system duplicated permease subunit
MILGTQWYMAFNVIAGAGAFPTDFKEAAAAFRIRACAGGAMSSFRESSRTT